MFYKFKVSATLCDVLHDNANTCSPGEGQVKTLIHNVNILVIEITKDKGAAEIGWKQKAVSYGKYCNS